MFLKGLKKYSCISTGKHLLINFYLKCVKVKSEES